MESEHDSRQLAARNGRPLRIDLEALWGLASQSQTIRGTSVIAVIDERSGAVRTAEAPGVLVFSESNQSRWRVLIRHLLSIAALPFTVAVLVPFWIGVAYSVPATAIEWVLLACGVACLLVGLTLFGASLRHFAVEGRGTLAPWDPPSRLVVSGPYRFVRNPMISGVWFVLLAEALMLRSVPLGLWAGAFLVVNGIYIPLIEEPSLIARFGDAYREYSRHVRRFWPRVRPWSASSSR